MFLIKNERINSQNVTSIINNEIHMGITMHIYQLHLGFTSYIFFRFCRMKDYFNTGMDEPNLKTLLKSLKQIFNEFRKSETPSQLTVTTVHIKYMVNDNKIISRIWINENWGNFVNFSCDFLRVCILQFYITWFFSILYLRQFQTDKKATVT